jgi:hypothetical protein
MTQCLACGRQWGAFGEHHCTNCHRHFGSLRAFDAHIRIRSRSDEVGDNEVTCTDPKPRKGVIWYQTEKGVWRKQDSRFASAMPREAQIQENAGGLV